MARPKRVTLFTLKEQLKQFWLSTRLIAFDLQGYEFSVSFNQGLSIYQGPAEPEAHGYIEVDRLYQQIVDDFRKTHVQGEPACVGITA